MGTLALGDKGNKSSNEYSVQNQGMQNLDAQDVGQYIVRRQHQATL